MPVLNEVEKTYICPDCGNEVMVRRIWDTDGFNDEGCWIVKCDDCSHVFSIALGVDVYYSQVKNGAEIIEKYDMPCLRFKKQRNRLAKYGLEI